MLTISLRAEIVMLKAMQSCSTCFYHIDAPNSAHSLQHVSDDCIPHFCPQNYCHPERRFYNSDDDKVKDPKALVKTLARCLGASTRT